MRGRGHRGSGPGKSLLFLAVLFSLTFRAFGQSATPAPDILPDTQSSSEFPLWARDLRRGEVVAFGSFPFAMFVSTFAVDSIRYFQHNRSNEYLPWPFKGVGAVETPRGDREKALIAAAVVSVAIAAIDFTIVQVKRNRAKTRVEQQNNGGGVRIIRNPITEDELTGENLETGGDSGGEDP